MDRRIVGSFKARRRVVSRLACLSVLLLLIVAAFGPPAIGQSSRIKTLLIGTSGALAPAATESKEKAALVSLKRLIKEETGLKSDIMRQKNWRDLAKQMADGELQVGVFQGYEFAWAREKFDGLIPLTLAVNSRRHLVAHVVVRESSTIKDFAGLEGQPLAWPKPDPPFVRLFLERECGARGKKPDAYFSKITMPDNIEDALDAVVEGEIASAVVDRAGLDAFKRRKPGRGKLLKVVAESPPVPTAVIAYQEKSLDKATLKRFRTGLERANKSPRGQTLLTLFRLTGFEAVPKDFESLLLKTREAFPAENEK